MNGTERDFSSRWLTLLIVRLLDPGPTSLLSVSCISCSSVFAFRSGGVPETVSSFHADNIRFDLADDESFVPVLHPHRQKEF